jgi:hypothetical protein
VNLADGRVEIFKPDEAEPRTGQYVALDALDRYCREHGIPLTETDGQMSALTART